MEQQNIMFVNINERDGAQASCLNTPVDNGFLGADLGPGFTQLLSNSLH